MLEALTSTNAADFKQRYQGVYGWFVQDGKKLLVSISSVTSQRVTFQDGDGTEYYAYSDKGVLFEFLPVTRQYINTPNGVYHLSRSPARQYKRGICYENTKVRTLLSTGLRSRDEDFHNVIQKCYTQSVPYMEAWVNRTKDSSCALNKYFAVTSSGLLYFHDVPIGKLEGTVATMSINVVNQEFLDMSNRAGYGFTIA